MHFIFRLKLFLTVGLLLALAACTKIDYTNVGSNLIPEVDNINTFDTTLTVVSNNYLFDDSTRLYFSDDHLVGGTAGDPDFGSTNAKVFFELKPTSYPFVPFAKDSLVAFDSAVLVLNFRGYWGDSSSPVTLQVHEVDQKMYQDTSNYPQYKLTPPLNPDLSKLWGEKAISVTQIDDTVAIKRGDSIYSKVVNQIRIPLDKAKAEALFRQDTVTGAFKSDSLFREYFKGFALSAKQPVNTQLYFNFSTNTRMEFYYRTKKGKIDTTSIGIGATSLTAHAQELKRNRSGARINDFLTPDDAAGQPEVFIQSTPGSYSLIKIPGLSGLSNRVVHRAELIVTQSKLPDNPVFTPPPGLLLDVKDTGSAGYRGLPYDYSPYTLYSCATGAIDFSYFGGLAKKKTINGTVVTTYTFSLNRYVQNIISKKETNYTLRLSAPLYSHYSKCISGISGMPSSLFYYQYQNNPIVQAGRGQVVVGGGNHADDNYRMKLRIIYSKI